MAGTTTILDIALRNLAAAGLDEVVIVVGHARQAIADRAAALERAHQVRLTLVPNDRALDWNNAYSLWLAREHFARGALLVNGDTVHPASVEKTLLAARGAAGVILALDNVKPLADEEMKVVLDERGLLARITKRMDPVLADGEYIGATLIEPVPRRGWPTRWRPPGGGIPGCTTRTATRNWPTAAARSRSRRSVRSTGSRWTTTTTCAAPGRSPGGVSPGERPPGTPRWPSGPRDSVARASALLAEARTPGGLAAELAPRS